MTPIMGPFCYTAHKQFSKRFKVDVYHNIDSKDRIIKINCIHVFQLLP